MTGFAARTETGVLDFLTGHAPLFAEPVAYLALFTSMPNAPSASGAVEVSATGYARVATGVSDWGPASGDSPADTVNNNAFTFTQAGSPWGTVVAIGLYDAVSSGNLLCWDWLGNSGWQPCTISSASPAIVTVPAHGFSTGNTVAFTNEFGGFEPTDNVPMQPGLLTVNTVPSGDTLTLQSGSTVIDTTTTGSGMITLVVPTLISLGAFFRIDAGVIQFFSA